MTTVVRSFYLSIVGAAFPLAFLHYDSFHPDYFAGLGNSSKGFIVFGTFFMIMFHLLFTARYFPFDLKSGIILLIGIISTVFTSSLLNNASAFLGAFSLVYATSLTYLIYFLTLSFLFLIPEKREKLFYYSEKPYIILLLFFVIVCSFVAWILTDEFFRAIKLEGNYVLVTFAVCSIGYEIFSGVKSLLHQNMFQFDKGPEKELRDEQLKKSAWITVLLMFASITCIALIIYVSK